MNSSKQNYHWPWHCNRGLMIRIRLRNQENVDKCLCPPSYYGDFCQYQNERASLTLGLVRAEKHDVYLIIMMLSSFTRFCLSVIFVTRSFPQKKRETRVNTFLMERKKEFLCTSSYHNSNMTFSCGNIDHIIYPFYLIICVMSI